MGATVNAVGLRCIRCGGRSIVAVDDVEGFSVDAERHDWACPHCTTPEDGDAGVRPIGRGYDITGFKVITEDYDPSDSIDDYDHRDDVLTETMRADVEAVEVRGKTAASRARDRGVARGTVTAAVRRARMILRGDDPYA